MIKFSYMMYAERKALGLTGQELAEKLGVSPSMVGHLENGRRTPSIDAVKAMAKISKLYPENRWHKAGARAHGWKV